MGMVAEKNLVSALERRTRCHGYNLPVQMMHSSAFGSALVGEVRFRISLEIEWVGVEVVPTGSSAQALRFRTLQTRHHHPLEPIVPQQHRIIHLHLERSWAYAVLEWKIVLDPYRMLQLAARREQS
jgi:hypothetical protein